MSTSAITRREVMYYTVSKKKIDKNIDGDSIKTKFKDLPKARAFAWALYNSGNFKSLVNSNDTTLPL